MFPIVFEIFGFTVHSFGLMVFTGFLAGYVCLQVTGPERGLSSRTVLSLALWILFSGIVGARLLYALVHWERPLEALMIWRGGFVFYGGALAGLAAALLFSRKRKIAFLTVADLLTPAAMLGLFFGRIGCFLAGDCYGSRAPEALPWAVEFPFREGSLIPVDLLYVPLHPTQIYLSLNALLLFVATLYIARQRRYEGQVFVAGLLLYGMTRGVLEFFRGDRAERGYFGPLSTSQWISAGMITLAVILYLSQKNGERR